MRFQSPERLTLRFSSELISIESYSHLMSYGPFGQGFELPDVELSNAQVKSATGLKNGFKWQVEVEGTRIDVLCFNGCDPKQFTKSSLNCIGRLSLNTFRSKISFSLMVESWT